MNTASVRKIRRLAFPYALLGQLTAVLATAGCVNSSSGATPDSDAGLADAAVLADAADADAGAALAQDATADAVAVNDAPADTQERADGAAADAPADSSGTSDVAASADVQMLDASRADGADATGDATALDAADGADVMGDATALDAADVTGDATALDAAEDVATPDASDAGDGGDAATACTYAACDGPLGLLREGTIVNLHSPSDPAASAFGGRAVAVAWGGDDLACAVAADGTVWCWNTGTDGGTDPAGNASGQLGNGTTSASAVPVQVMTNGANGPAPLTNATAVFAESTRGQLACALDAAGGVWCWGNGTPYATPVLLSDGQTQFTGVKKLAITTTHTCAVTSDGNAWCWGDNTYGEIGVGTTPRSPVDPNAVYSSPVEVNDFSVPGPDVVDQVVVTDIAVAPYSTCAITTPAGYYQATVYCWGSNSHQQLAQAASSRPSFDSPLAVNTGIESDSYFTDAVAIEMFSTPQANDGYGGVCALSSNGGAVWCWGDAYTEDQAILQPLINIASLGRGVDVIPCAIDGSGTLFIAPSANEGSKEATCP
jgi:hypothetical protein